MLNRMDRQARRVSALVFGLLAGAALGCGAYSAPPAEEDPTVRSDAAPVADAPAANAPAPGGAPAMIAPLTQYRTSDGFTLAAELDVPAPGASGADGAPLVVLGHQVGKTRRSWDPLVPRLVEAGYSVIRMDHRAFGESTFEVPSPAKLTNEHKWGLYLDFVDAIDAARHRPGVDVSRVAVIGTGLSVNAAVECWNERPEVQALVLMSGVIQKEQVLNLMSAPEMPLLLVAASGNATDRNVMRRYEGRFLGPGQQYIEFDPLHEDDPANWQGTDGLNDETGLPDLILWFLQEHLPPR